MGETAQKGFFTRFTSDQIERLRKQRKKMGIPMTKFVMDAVLAKLAMHEEENRREAEERRRRKGGRPRSLGLGLDRRDIPPPVANVSATVTTPTSAPTPPPLNITRLAKHILEAPDESERKRRFAAMTETLFAAAETPDKADADVAAVYAIVRSALEQNANYARTA